MTTIPRDTAPAHSRVDFSAPATLKKWVSHFNQRVDGSTPYSILDGTLDDCVKKFLEKPAKTRHLYEIHTAPQAAIVTAVIPPEHILELVRLREVL